LISRAGRKEENNKKPYKIKKAYKNLPLFIFVFFDVAWKRVEEEEILHIFLLENRKCNSQL